MNAWNCARLFKVCVYVCESVNACENVCLRGMREGEREERNYQQRAFKLVRTVLQLSKRGLASILRRKLLSALSLSLFLSLTLLIPLSPLLLSHFLFPCLIFHSLKDPERSWEPRELEIAGSGIPSLREAFLERRA